MKYTIVAIIAVLMMGSFAMADSCGRGGGRGDWGGGDRHGGDRHGGSHWSVSVGFGFGSPSYERYPRVYCPPVYRERVYVPAPVYYPPPVVYVPAPVYCPPPQVYYSPPVYCPPPTVYYQPVYRPAYDYNYSRVSFYYRD